MDTPEQATLVMTALHKMDMGGMQVSYLQLAVALFWSKFGSALCFFDFSNQDRSDNSSDSTVSQA
jgi:hypothetical protein